MTTTHLGTNDPTVAPPIDHAEAMVLAGRAYDLLVTDIEALDPDDWTKPTDCEGWTVRDLVGHLAGAMRSAASVRELGRQQLAVKRRTRKHGGEEIFHLGEVQIESVAGLSPAEVAAECRRLVPRATAGRRRMPGLLRRFATVRVRLGSLDERWTLGYFVDVILTRDAWLHRVDLARAVGRDLELTPAHDGRIVADIAAEWIRRHSAAVDLTLTGPAGGRFTSGAPAEAVVLELDSVEFCRILSGRAPGRGLLATEVPF